MPVAGRVAVVGGPVARRRRGSRCPRDEGRHRPASERLHRTGSGAEHGDEGPLVGQQVQNVRALGQDQPLGEGAIGQHRTDPGPGRHRPRRFCQAAHVRRDEDVLAIRQRDGRHAASRDTFAGDAGNLTDGPAHCGWRGDDVGTALGAAAVTAVTGGAALEKEVGAARAHLLACLLAGRWAGRLT